MASLVQTYTPSGEDFETVTAKQVKNLGWLLRHAGKVDRVIVTRLSRGGAYLEARLTVNGKYTVYSTDFADFTIAAGFVLRFTRRGIPVQLQG